MQIKQKKSVQSDRNEKLFVNLRFCSGKIVVIYWLVCYANGLQITDNVKVIVGTIENCIQI